MLFLIDITVFTLKIAICQDMKKNIGGIFRKSYGFFQFFHAS
jgi:hypothetical protein